MSVFYRCWVCGKVFGKQELEPFSEKALREGYTFIRCPICGSKLIVKSRKSGSTKIEAI